jgi:hypothetical protein
VDDQERFVGEITVGVEQLWVGGAQAGAISLPRQLGASGCSGLACHQAEGLHQKQQTTGAVEEREKTGQHGSALLLERGQVGGLRQDVGNGSCDHQRENDHAENQRGVIRHDIKHLQ